MDVKVKYRLSCNRTVVGKKVETFKIERLDDAARHDMDCVHNPGQFPLLDIKKIPVMLSGYDKGVTVVDRVDIQN
jgi:hypothetical protein